MRLFTAIKLSKEALDHIEELQQQLKKDIPCKKWQKVANMHLTLHFLGEVEEGKVSALKQHICSVTKTCSSFSLQLKDWGAFPNEKKPRIVWIGINGDLEPLRNLQSSLAPVLKDYGYAEEDKGYSPHITLARNPSEAVNWDKLRLELPIKPIQWKVEDLILYQSHMKPGGVEYTIYEKFQFKN